VIPDRPPPAPNVIAFEWNTLPDQRIDDMASVRDGTLVLRGTGVGSIAGHALPTAPLRDAVIDCVVRPVRLADDEGFGVFVRQQRPDRYVGIRVTPGRIVAISGFDGDEQPIAVGPLAEAMVLHADRNRMQVAAVGPSITFSLNGLVVTSVLVDPRFIDGHVGVLLEQRADTVPELIVEWAQLRDVW
jgi:hypothetical protein